MVTVGVEVYPGFGMLVRVMPVTTPSVTVATAVAVAPLLGADMATVGAE